MYICTSGFTSEQGRVKQPHPLSATVMRFQKLLKIINSIIFMIQFLKLRFFNLSDIILTNGVSLLVGSRSHKSLSQFMSWPCMYGFHVQMAWPTWWHWRGPCLHLLLELSEFLLSCPFFHVDVPGFLLCQGLPGPNELSLHCSRELGMIRSVISSSFSSIGGSATCLWPTAPPPLPILLLPWWIFKENISHQTTYVQIPPLPLSVMDQVCQGMRTEDKLQKIKF